MYKSFKLFYLILAFVGIFCGINPLKAQTLAFENYTVENGLKAPRIISIYQSHDDLIWIGTANGGVFKFDGRTFINYTEKNGILSNAVYAIGQDEKKRILIGTLKGLNISNDGKRFRLANDKDSLTTSGIVKIFKDSKKRVWLGLAKGVALLKDTVVTKFQEKYPFSGVTVTNIEEDHLGRIWFSTVKGGAICWDGKDFKIYDKNNGIQYGVVYSVYYRGEGKFWVLGHKCIYELDENANIAPGDSIIRLKKLAFPGLDTIPKAYYNYQVDKSGVLWIGSESGLYRIAKGRATVYTEAQGLVKSDIWRIIQDREGNMWFGSKSDGISKLSSERFLFYNHPEGGNEGSLIEVESLIKDAYGKIYAGSQKGVFNLNNNQFDSIPNINFKNPTPISSILVNENQELFVGNSGTVFRISGKKGMELFFSESGKPGHTEKVRSLKLIETNLHDMLAATTSSVWKLENETFRPVQQITKVLGSQNEFVNDIYQDDNSSLWIGYTKGLKVLTYPDYLEVPMTKLEKEIKTPVKQIIKNASGDYFFATDKGIYRWDNQNVYNYTIENSGLISNQISSLTIDKKGVMWAGLSNGFAKIEFDKENKGKVHVKCYDLESGFLGQSCNSRAILVDEPTGHIFFGTAKGVLVFQPEFDIPNTSAPFLMFKDIKLFSDTTDWSKKAEKLDENDLPIDLELGFSENHLTFSFVGVSNYYPLKIRYQYYLKGYEDGYCVPTTKNEISYPNLPFGEYEFFVKSCNADGVWNEKPISFKFTINPPFWRTWWFYAILLLIAASGVFSYIQIRLANSKITSQNIEISHQKELIEKKNNEVLDSINYAKTIQEAILPPDSTFMECFAGAFVLYKPKDIVSGDFYWMEKVGNKMVFAVVDCTGHGVPGAFMSIVGHNALNQAIKENKILTASKILDYLNKYVNETLHTSYTNSEGRKVRDGMDMSLCVFDVDTLVIEYAGAYNPLVLIRKGELTEIKADRRPIGSTDLYGDQNFKNNEIQLQKGDRVYLFSDGYADQFGGPEGKKFYKGKFKDTLITIEQKPMTVQKEILLDIFTNWKGTLEQVDDICIIGVQI